MYNPLLMIDFYKATHDRQYPADVKVIYSPDTPRMSRLKDVDEVVYFGGQAYFSHSELQNKSCAMIQDMLMEKYRINWSNYPGYQKRGSCCVKVGTKSAEIVVKDGSTIAFPARPHWVIDKDIPIFKNEGREYIEKLIQPEEE